MFSLPNAFVLMPSRGGAQTCTAERWNPSLTTLRSSHSTIQQAVDSAQTREIILVSGTCTENVSVGEEKARITLDGQGSANLVAVQPTSNTIQIFGKGIIVTGFASIREGNHGILLAQGGTAVIINNTIESNNNSGIIVEDGATARIGFNSGNDTIASPNIIRNNAANGIIVGRSSNARIVGNIISGNGAAGILVKQVSQADIASNTIDDNHTDGISVSGNSGVNLGNDSGTTIFDQPNSTTINNYAAGVSCAMKSYVAGRLGTLNGNNGLLQLDGRCAPRDFTDAPFGGTTSGNIADTGRWTVTVLRETTNPVRVRLNITGAGTSAATFDMCPATGAERVFLDQSGEIADIDCVDTTGVKTGSHVYAFAANPQIEIRKPAADAAGVVVSMFQDNGVTIGSPIIPDPNNTQPIGVELVDVNDVESAFFALDANQKVDVTPPEPESNSTTSNVVVLAGTVGTITMELTGQTATAVLGTGASVDLQSDTTSGATDLTVAPGSAPVTVVVDGQPVPVNPGQTFSQPVAVAIDIQPGAFPNQINRNSGGGTPVAILGSATFDAKTVNPLTVTLAGAAVKLKQKGVAQASYQDVNGDGFVDLVLHMETSRLQLEMTSTDAVLVGFTFPVVGKTATVSGSDSVVMVH